MSKYTVVGRLFESRSKAVNVLRRFRRANPKDRYEWGLVEINPPSGDKQARAGRVSIPPPPALLKRLEGLLSKDRVVRSTKAGKVALALLRTALKPKRR